MCDRQTPAHCQARLSYTDKKLIISNMIFFFLPGLGLYRVNSINNTKKNHSVKLPMPTTNTALLSSGGSLDERAAVVCKLCQKESADIQAPGTA